MNIDARSRFSESFRVNNNSLNHCGPSTAPADCANVPLADPCPKGKHCNCSFQREASEKLCNPWADIEKAIFIDKFLQHPKNFGMISKYLINKSTKDCVAFYYLSKTRIPYKELLREQQQRRKAHGLSQVEQLGYWKLIAQTLQSIGLDVDPSDFDQNGYLMIKDKMLERDEKILNRKRRKHERKRKKKKEIQKLKKKQNNYLRQKLKQKKKQLEKLEELGLENNESSHGEDISAVKLEIHDINELTNIELEKNESKSVKKTKKKKKKTKKQSCLKYNASSVVGLDEQYGGPFKKSKFFFDMTSGVCYDIDRFENSCLSEESSSSDSDSFSESSDSDSDGTSYYAKAYHCDVPTALAIEEAKQNDVDSRSRKTRTLLQMGSTVNTFTRNQF
eukprot:GSMAST32.ASY1.ANO1.1763.1 assembled CDS